MNKKITSSLLVSGLFLVSAITSINVQAAPNYRVLCTGTTSGNSWIEVTGYLGTALDLAAICMQQGGTPTISS